MSVFIVTFVSQTRPCQMPQQVRACTFASEKMQMRGCGWDGGNSNTLSTWNMRWIRGFPTVNRLSGLCCWNFTDLSLTVTRSVDKTLKATFPLLPSEIIKLPLLYPFEFVHALKLRGKIRRLCPVPPLARSQQFSDGVCGLHNLCENKQGQCNDLRGCILN